MLPFGGIARIRFNGYNLNSGSSGVPPQNYVANIAIISIP